jgi:diadenosine tetraphosphate (Ap4A) HIT family hydrolase
MPFCSIEEKVLENEHTFAIYDKYPVNERHLLIIPKKHKSDFFETSYEEREAFNKLLEDGRKLLKEKFNPQGFNIGVNCGHTAGQTIFHVHVHLIPRYEGDMEDPAGGVRGVIPERQKY